MSSSLFEAPKRSRFIFEYGAVDYLHVEGFEIRYGAGHGIGGWSGTPNGIEVINNHVHHCEGNGVSAIFL